MNTAPPIRITLTGAAGQIGYSLLPRIAAGELFGPDQPVRLQLLEVTPAMKALEGVAMELQDCAFPTLAQVDITDDPAVAFDQTQWALLVGARPRGPGMERNDLLTANAPIFATQGKAINDHASKDVRVLVVGNPANTNALITMKHAPDVPAERFSAMTRLDHNRAVSLLAQTLQTTPNAIKKMSIWGNHSSTMVVDTSQVVVNGKTLVETQCIASLHQTFVSTIQNRGAAIIEKRGFSSALSAANAIIDHLQSWNTGTPPDDWASMAVISHGEYGAPAGTIFSFPCICTAGTWEIVPGLTLPADIQQGIAATGAELLQEQTAVA